MTTTMIAGPRQLPTRALASEHIREESSTAEESAHRAWLHEFDSSSPVHRIQLITSSICQLQLIESKSSISKSSLLQLETLSPKTRFLRCDFQHLGVHHDISKASKSSSLHDTEASLGKDYIESLRQTRVPVNIEDLAYIPLHLHRGISRAGRQSNSERGPAMTRKILMN